MPCCILFDVVDWVSLLVHFCVSLCLWVCGVRFLTVSHSFPCDLLVTHMAGQVAVETGVSTAIAKEAEDLGTEGEGLQVEEAGVAGVEEELEARRAGSKSQ